MKKIMSGRNLGPNAEFSVKVRGLPASFNHWADGYYPAPPPPPSSSLLDSSSGQRSLPPSIPSNSLLNAADAEEIVAVKRVPETTMRLWEGLLKKRGFEVKSGKLTRSPSKSQGSGIVDLGDNMTRSPSPSPIKHRVDTMTEVSTATRSESSISAFRRSKSFASKETPASSSKLGRPLQRILSNSAAETSVSNTSFSDSLSDLLPNTVGTSSASSFLAPLQEELSTTNGESVLFLGRKFCLLGEAKTPKFREAIQSCGGTLVPRSSEEVDYIVVRFAR